MFKHKMEHVCNLKTNPKRNMAPPRINMCASMIEGFFTLGIIPRCKSLFETYLFILAFSIMFYATIVSTASTQAVPNTLNNSNSGSVNAVVTSMAKNLSTNTYYITTQAVNIVNTTTASTIVNATTNGGFNTTFSTSSNTSFVSSQYSNTTPITKTQDSTLTNSISSSSVFNSTTDERSSFQSTSLESTDKPTSVPMTTCTPPPVKGGMVSKSTSGSLVFISCPSGYNIKGPNVLRCVNGQWDPSPPPSCVKVPPPRTDVHNKVDVNDIGVPTWLLWTICAVIGLLGFLILCCVLYVCLKIFGCISGPRWGTDNRVHPFVERHPICLCCLERTVGIDDQKRNQKYLQRPRKSSQLTFLEKKKNRETSSRLTVQRNGQESFRDRGYSLPNTGSPEQNRKLVVKVRKKQRAKSVSDWLPHSNNIRNINTSTK